MPRENLLDVNTLYYDYELMSFANYEFCRYHLIFIHKEAL